jgi:hypothetical protein
MKFLQKYYRTLECFEAIQHSNFLFSISGLSLSSSPNLATLEGARRRQGGQAVGTAGGQRLGFRQHRKWLDQIRTVAPMAMAAAGGEREGKEEVAVGSRRSSAAVTVTVLRRAGGQWRRVGKRKKTEKKKIECSRKPKHYSDG